MLLLNAKSCSMLVTVDTKRIKKLKGNKYES